jgi:glutamate synthase (NADPH/NADH) small chain
MHHQTAAPDVPDDRLEENFDDYKPPMGGHEAVAEAERCLYCSDAPCIDGCPTNIDIPEFIRRIATGNVAGSAKTILEQNILGLSCARVCPTEVLCEGECVYHEMDEPPIQIGRLQRHATEQAYEEGIQFFEAGQTTGKRIGIIGAGPAGLACAHQARRRGHEAVVFEAASYPGGLNTDGVAPYKFKYDDSIREYEYVMEIGGIDVRYETAVSEDVELDDLESEFDAIFIGVGLGADRWLPVDGSDLEGVLGANEFISTMKTEPGFELPDALESVAVVGGGNTASDVTRELAGVGVDDVKLVYRREEETMSGYDHEWEGAKKAGVQGVWRAQPIEILGDDHVEALRCRNTRDIDGPDGDTELEIVEGTDFDIDCDAVVLAIGQSKLGEMFADRDGIELRSGKIVVDSATGQTGRPQYFAGGDCVNGGSEVVDAAQAAKVAMRGMDDYLS